MRKIHPSIKKEKIDLEEQKCVWCMEGARRSKQVSSSISSWTIIEFHSKSRRGPLQGVTLGNSKTILTNDLASLNSSGFRCTVYDLTYVCCEMIIIISLISIPDSYLSNLPNSPDSSSSASNSVFHIIQHQHP